MLAVGGVVEFHAFEDNLGDGLAAGEDRLDGGAADEVGLPIMPPVRSCR